MKLLQSFKILQNLAADLGPVLALFLLFLVTEPDPILCLKIFSLNFTLIIFKHSDWLKIWSIQNIYRIGAWGNGIGDSPYHVQLNICMGIDKCFDTSVTRLCNLLDLWQLFKAFGNN